MQQSESDTSDTKIFVGGLVSCTVEATLIEYFQSFGEVIDCVIMKDKGTGRTRGFGFVTFKEPYQKDVNTLLHFIDGKQVDVRPAETKNQSESDTSDTKIFVGGLASYTVEATVIEHFQTCGEVIDCVIMKDKETGRPRGFGFVTFKEPYQLEEAVGRHQHIIDGKQVDVKPAKAKNSGDHFRSRGSHFGSRGSHFGSRGGNYGSRGGHFGNTDGGGAYGGPSGGRYGGPYGGPRGGPYGGPYGGPSGGPYGGPSGGSYGYPN